MRPCRQKFLPLLHHRNFWTFQFFSNLFSEKSIFRDFDVRFFEVMRCAPTEISFWGDRHRLEVKPHGRPKSRTRPPRGVINLFSSLRDLKIHFPRKIMFFSLKKPSFFCIYLISYLLEVLPDHPRIGFLKSQGNEGCDPASRNFCISLKW